MIVDEWASHVTLVSTQALSLELAGERRSLLALAETNRVIHRCFIFCSVGSRTLHKSCTINIDTDKKKHDIARVNYITNGQKGAWSKQYYEFIDC